MRLIRCLLALCLLAIPSLAQTASLRGQVTDESGAIVPGAKVTLSGERLLPATSAVGRGRSC
jgi:hypothetical protein